MQDELFEKLQEHCQKYSYEQSEFIRSLLRSKLFNAANVGGDLLAKNKDSLFLPESPKTSVKPATKLKNELCPHLISKGGYCVKCGGIAK